MFLFLTRSSLATILLLGLAIILPSNAIAQKAPATASGKPAKAAFDKAIIEWKQLLKDLQGINSKYDAAEGSEADEYRKQWDVLVAQGETLIPKLRIAAQKAYLESPNEDRSLSRFMMKMLADLVARDDFEPAAELSQILIDNKCDIREVYKYAGLAAYAVNRFDKAEEYLKLAGELGVLADTKDKVYMSAYTESAKYKKLWEEEQKIRKKEAEADDLPRVRITTSKGPIIIELFENEAPETVGNFVSLVENKFYDGIYFHRVLKNFMAQGGDPQGNGSGGPGYNIYCECYKPDYRRHFRGTLSMAKTVRRDTGGSQFFLTFVPTSHLNGQHTAFGRVIEGMDVLAKLQRVDPSGEPPLPEPDKIIKAEVIRKRDHKYAPNKVQ